MKTTKYKATRILAQVFAALQIILNLVAIITIYYSNIQKIELYLPTKPTIYFGDLGTYLCAGNILFSIIAACCITSKFKLWMRQCQKLLLCQISFNMCCLGYFYIFYFQSIIECLNLSILTQGQILVSLLMSLGITPINGSIVLGFQTYIEFYLRIFSLLQLGSVACTAIIFSALKYTANIRLEIKKKPTPRIAEASKLGLRQKLTEIKRVQMAPMSVPVST